MASYLRHHTIYNMNLVVYKVTIYKMRKTSYHSNFSLILIAFIFAHAILKCFLKLLKSQRFLTLWDVSDPTESMTNVSDFLFRKKNIYI